MGRARLIVPLTVSTAIMLLLMGILLFWPAGTFDYWEAWLFLGVFFALTLGISGYFLVHDPSLLARRLRYQEPERQQQIFQSILGVCYFGGMVIAGLDHRYGWSHVPPALVVVAEVVTIAAFIFIGRVFAENRYAGSTIEVETEQQVISTGPYALVRHPMYLGAVPYILSIGLALGSYWAEIPYLVIVIGIIFRIHNEESVLLRDLPGYAAYRQQVRWRLIPGIW